MAPEVLTVPQSISPADPRLAWEGAISLESTPEWVRAWRLPQDRLDLYPSTVDDMLVARAAMPAGVRLAFITDATEIVGAISTDETTSPIDLRLAGDVIISAPLAGRESFSFAGLPAGEKLVELWLPQFGEFRLLGLEIPDGATLAERDSAADDRPRWITYGSSITQCRDAASPTQTWPAVAARALNLHLTCLGFGGQCHLDPLIARIIRDRPADYLSICVGINIYGAASFGQRAFRPAIIGFVETIREKHPDAPFAVMSPIVSPPREMAYNAVGFTLERLRDEVQAAVATLRAHGDRNLHYVDGIDLFGPDLAHLLPDDLHPNAEGYRLLGERFTQLVGRNVFGIG
jgi:lysophospholipase L1-like esterase